MTGIWQISWRIHAIRWQRPIGSRSPASLRAKQCGSCGQGIHLSDGRMKADSVRLVRSHAKKSLLEVVLSEGRNREIRRMLAQVGHKVQQLTRTAIGPLRLGDLPTGAYRELTREEVRKLRRSVRTCLGGPPQEVDGFAGCESRPERSLRKERPTNFTRIGARPLPARSRPVTRRGKYEWTRKPSVLRIRPRSTRSPSVKTCGSLRIPFGCGFVVRP